MLVLSSHVSLPCWLTLFCVSVSAEARGVCWGCCSSSSHRVISYCVHSSRHPARRADRLTVLGIRPIIASLSLGATRKFRIHNEAAKPPKSQGRAPTSSRASAANTAAAQDTVLSASIKLTHNMLVRLQHCCCA